MNKDVERFLDANGVLVIWPKKHSAKNEVLEYLASKFEDNKAYTEQEVNEILKQWHTFADWPLLRRELVDSDFLSRDKNGYEYKKVKK